MEKDKHRPKRGRFQGISGILYFNWPNYLIAILFIALLGVLEYYMPSQRFSIYRLALLLIGLSVFSSLLISYYIHDLSPLYRLSWMQNLPKIPYRAKIALVHAGIDEISPIVTHLYPDSRLLKYNIFNTHRHKEREEKRIRSKYALPHDTVSISTSFLPLAPHSVDAIFLVLSTGELKDHKERIYFFQQMQEALKPKGQLIFVEHTRDLPNLLAYTWGAFEFLKRGQWEAIFRDAKLNVVYHRGKITPFLNLYSLGKMR